MENHRVLIVENEEAVREVMVTLLAARGCIVETACSAAEALPLLMKEDYDLVMCDLRLPGVDGRTLYQQVRAMRPAMAERFLICTGDTASEETYEFLEASHLPVLRKPFRREDLVRATLPFFQRLSSRPR